MPPEPMNLEVSIQLLAQSFTTGLASLKSTLESFASSMAAISDRQVAQTKGATESILDSYKKRIEFIKKEAEEKKAAVEAIAAANNRPEAFKQTAFKDIELETQNKKIQAAAEYSRQRLSQANELKLATLQAEQDLALKMVESQKGYQNKSLEAAQQYNAARLGLEMQLVKDLEKIANAPNLSGAQKKKLTTAAIQKANEEQAQLAKNYSLKYVDLVKNTELQALKEKERIARFANDKLAIIRINAEKETIARLSEIRRKAVEEEGIRFNPDDERKRALEIKKIDADKKASIDEMRKSVALLTDEQEKLAKAQMNEAALQALNQVALKAVAAGAAITAAFAAAIKPAMELEKALAGVAAVAQVVATSSGMVQLRDLAIDLGRQFLFSSGTIANGMKTLSQAGFDIPEINAMTKDILNLATAADMPLNNAFDIASTTLRAFKMEATEMSRVANTLTSTANMTNVEVTDLAESFKYIGPVAAAAGVDFEDVSAALGIMGNAGIKASMGGTALRQAVSALIAPTSQQRTMLRELGLEVQDAEGNFVGFAEIVRQMEGLFTNSVTDPAQQAGIAMKLFGDRAGPGMLAIIKEGHTAFTTLAKDLKDSRDANLDGGAAAKTAADRMKNLTDQMTLFGKATSGLATTILYPLLDVMGKIVTKVNEWVNALTDFFAEHKNWATVAASVAGLVAVIGTLLTVVGTVTLAFTGLGLAMTANAKHGIAWLSLLTFGLKTTKVAADQTRVALAGVGTAGAIAASTASKVAMGVMGWAGIILAVVTTLLPLIITLWEKFGGGKDELDGLSATGKKLHAEYLEGEKNISKQYQKNAELAQELIDTTTKLHATRAKELAELAPAALRKTGKLVEDDQGKLVDETVAPTLQEASDRVQKILRSMMETRAESEGLNANEELTTAEYVKQKRELDQLYNIKKNLGKLAIDDLNRQIDQLANLERQETDRFEKRRDEIQGSVPTPDSLDGGFWIMSPEEQATGLARIDAIKQQIVQAKELKKVFDSHRQAQTNELNAPFVANLEGLGDLLEAANKKYAERNQLKTDELALEKSLMEVTDTHLTMEEKQFAFNKKVIASKHTAADTELENLRKIQKESNDLFQSEAAQLAARERNQASIQDQFSGKDIQTATQATDPLGFNVSDLERDANKLKVASETATKAIATNMRAEIAAMVATKEQAMASVAKFSIELINLERTTYNHLLSLKSSYLTQTMAMTRDEFDQRSEFLRRETEAAKNEDDRRKASQAEVANAQQFAVSETAKATALMATMSSSELGSLAQQSGTAFRILEEQKKNQQAVEAEGRKSDVAKVLQYLRNADVATEQYERINRAIKANTEASLAGAQAEADAHTAKITKRKQELDTLLIESKVFIDQLASYAKDKPAIIEAQLRMTQIDSDLEKLNQKVEAALKEPKILEIQLKLDDKGIAETISSATAKFKQALSTVFEPLTPRAEYVTRAAGGPIPGSGSGDTVPAMLEPGEFVIRKSSVKAFGTSFFAALNNMSSPGLPGALKRIAGTPRLAFASGGAVPKSGGTTNLNLNLGGKKYPLIGRREVVAALTEQLRREGLTS